MRHTLATDLLLLTHDPDEGHALVDATNLDVAVVAACLVDLVTEGVLAIATEASAPAPIGHLYATGEPLPELPLLAELATRAAGHTPQDTVRTAGLLSTYNAAGLRRELLQRLATEGVLDHGRRRALGLLSYDVWLPTDPTIGAGLRAEVRTALTDPAAPSEHVVALVSLLGALDVARRLYPDLEAAAIATRIEELQRSDWGSAAVRSTADSLEEWLPLLVLGVFAFGAIVAS